MVSTARERGGASRDRTDDLKLAKLALSQLSYGPIRRKFHKFHVPRGKKPNLAEAEQWWAE
jgi:hypothetical protein